MAATFRAVGSWENGATGLTADEVLAVPAAQVTGDMVLVLGSWKDFSITAVVSGYTELTEFADGTVGTGNGAGSMKVAAWYKEATSDTEADPTLDFSTTTGLLGEGTIIVFAKAAGETWLTPLFVTAAWPSSSAQTISASSTVAVPSAGAVVGLLGIRDDSSTFTRTTTSIDVASGITWNGNYVEAPGTHASTTTGNDMSCDAGYRLVTAGGTVTLRMEATLSAAETGAALWVVLGSTTLITPDTAALTLATFAPTVTATEHQLVTPGVLALTTSTFAPTVTASDHKTVTPDVASLTLTGFAPVIDLGITVPAASLSLSTFAPTVSVTDNVTVTPGTAALALALFAPTVTASDNIVVTPDVVALNLSTFAPTVTIGANQVVTPDTASLLLATYVPTVTASGAPAPSGDGKGRLFRLPDFREDDEEALLF